MCDPVSLTAATLAITAASAGATIYSQQQQADAQSKINERQSQNIYAANAANQNQVNVQEQQSREQAIQKKTENDLVAREAIARGRTAAGESGVSGLSVNYLLADLAGKRDKFDSSVDANYNYAYMNSENQRANVAFDSASAINGLKSPIMPDYIGAGLRIAQAGVDYKTSMNKIP
ncbi:MAG: hypothetical protein B7X60_00025 [Polynucleobacter sp. 39-45-136]|jgi:hypothetical protein|nr:MAG: hypothetical protein B7X60_00025 [Polynucleobacter sp. 39-45-136]